VLFCDNSIIIKKTLFNAKDLFTIIKQITRNSLLIKEEVEMAVTNFKVSINEKFLPIAFLQQA
jgi:hypothetical protein